MSGGAMSMYRRSVALDPAVHGRHRVVPLTDYAVAAHLHAVFVTATEFAQAALEFPLLFVDSGPAASGGPPTVTTIALLGLSVGENLVVEGGRWTARYIPAVIRRYPFATASLPGAANLNVLVDDSWPGFSEHAGEALFGAEGQPAPALTQALDFLTRFEEEAERTRAFCRRVEELGLLREMKADASLPNGQQLAIDGFSIIDEAKLQALPEATVAELHRSGMLMLMQAHLLSLANIRHLVNRKAERAERSATPGELAALRSRRS